MRLPIIDTKSAISYHDTINEFEPFFEDFIEENGQSESSVFIAISVALRIAAKLCKKFKIKKENFTEAANVNYELENYN
jgi:uncharacterized membrane protein